MTSEILKMRFSHYLGEFADDKGFLLATYQAGLQVERMKTLEKAQELQQSQLAEPRPWKRKKRRERGAIVRTNVQKETTTGSPRPNRPKNTEVREDGHPTRWPWKESHGRSAPSTPA